MIECVQIDGGVIAVRALLDVAVVNALDVLLQRSVVGAGVLTLITRQLLLVVLDADVRGERDGGAAFILALVTVVLQAFMLDFDVVL